MSDLSSTLPSPNSDISVLIPLLLSQLSDIDTAVILTHLPRLYERLEHLRSAFNPSVRHCIAIKSKIRSLVKRRLVRIISHRNFKVRTR